MDMFPDCMARRAHEIVKRIRIGIVNYSSYEKLRKFLTYLLNRSSVKLTATSGGQENCGLNYEMYPRGILSNTAYRAQNNNKQNRFDS